MESNFSLSAIIICNGDNLIVQDSGKNFKDFNELLWFIELEIQIIHIACFSYRSTNSSGNKQTAVYSCHVYICFIYLRINQE